MSGDAPHDDSRPAGGFDLYRVAAIKAEADAQREQVRRKRGPRPRPYAVQRVYIELPVDLITAIDAAAPNRTAFIERAIRAALTREAETEGGG